MPWNTPESRKLRAKIEAGINARVREPHSRPVTANALRLACLKLGGFADEYARAHGGIGRLTPDHMHDCLYVFAWCKAHGRTLADYLAGDISRFPQALVDLDAVPAPPAAEKPRGWTGEAARIRKRVLGAVDKTIARGNVASWTKGRDDSAELGAYAEAMGWTDDDALDRARAARQRQHEALA
jgi:hypothetical protein